MNTGFYLSAVLLLMVACKKDSFPEEKYYFGSISATKNGQRWEAFIYGGANHYSTFGIGIHKFQEPGLLSESLTIHNLPKRPGTYRILKFRQYGDSTNIFAYYYTTQADGDVPCDYYDVVEEDSASNYITIQNFNLATGEFNGVFLLKLLIRLPKCRSNVADTLLFQNAVFNSKIMN